MSIGKQGLLQITLYNKDDEFQEVKENIEKMLEILKKAYAEKHRRRGRIDKMPQDHTDKKGKKGRPLKKDYDAETLMQELIDTVAEVYKEKQEIKATAIELSLPANVSAK